MEGFGKIVAHFRGRAKAGSAAQWDRDVELVWDAVSSAVSSQAGFLSTKTFWNLDDSREVLMLAYWNSLPERLAYERSAAGSVRANMETTLEAVPVRLKYELVAATGAPLSKLRSGVCAEIVSGVAGSALGEGASGLRTSTLVPKQAGELGTHVLLGMSEERNVHVMTFWTDAQAMRGAAEARMDAAIVAPPIGRNRYYIVRTT